MKTIDSLTINGEKYWLRTSVEAEDHSEYFQVTEDGALSLKPEYRGEPANNTYPDAISDNGVGVAGSRNADLPEHLVIPEVVGEVAVNSLATGMFYANKAIKSVTLPKTITVIPESCFNECLVEVVHNIEQVASVLTKAFRNSNIRSAWMPNLTALGSTAFCQCPMLTHVHIGKVASIHYDTFFKSRFLSRIESNGLITAIGSTAFMNTNRLVNANIDPAKLTSIGNGAFVGTGWDADWSKMDKSRIEKVVDAIWPQYHDEEFWIGCQPTACENPLPTLLCQKDPRWTNSLLIRNGKNDTWYNGCQMFSYLHIYCGLNDKKLNHVDEFVDIVEGIKPGHMSTFVSTFDHVASFCEPLGMMVTEYDTFTPHTLQALYDALARGGYAIVRSTSGSEHNGRYITGHAIIAYGATASGRLLIADSDWRYVNDQTSGVTYPVLFKTFIASNYVSNADTQFCIVEKPIEDQYTSIEDALSGTNRVTNGSVGAYTDRLGNYHIVLLNDLESAATIPIQRDCTLHLNGHTLAFTAAGAYLNIDTATEVVIDGSAVRSEILPDGSVEIHKGTIKKNGVTSTLSEHEDVIKTTGTNLTIYGGVYENTNSITASNKDTRVITSGVSTPPAKIKMQDCTVNASGFGTGRVVYGIVADDLELHNSKVEVKTNNRTAAAVNLYVEATLEKNTLIVESQGTGQVIGVNTYNDGVSCNIVQTKISATGNGFNNATKTSEMNHVRGVFVAKHWTVSVEDCDITAVRNNPPEPVPSGLETTVISSISSIPVDLDGSNTFTPAYP